MITLAENNIDLVIPSLYDIIASRGDNLSRRIPFEFPLCPSPYVNLNDYTLAIKFYNEEDVYSSNEAIEVEVDGDKIRFAWEPTIEATAIAGRLTFSVCALDEDNAVHWNSGLGYGKVVENADMPDDGLTYCGGFFATEKEVEDMYKNVYGMDSTPLDPNDEAQVIFATDNDVEEMLRRIYKEG